MCVCLCLFCEIVYDLVGVLEFSHTNGKPRNPTGEIPNAKTKGYRTVDKCDGDLELSARVRVRETEKRKLNL